MLLIVLIGQGRSLVASREELSDSLLIWMGVLMFFECMTIPFILGLKVSPGLRVVSM